MIGAETPYLLGVVKNLGDEREGIAIAEELLRARLDARDHMLAPLVHARDVARASEADPPRPPAPLRLHRERRGGAGRPVGPHRSPTRRRNR
ncbi:hypothetical protein WMF04_32590 [Sorangium sp. So ce260]|uniref:hypothetical protein n=1 Tax=Sorangium sp. So ce260 TaxID=3133291 RepID=UPI003F618C28